MSWSNRCIHNAVLETKTCEKVKSVALQGEMHNMLEITNGIKIYFIRHVNLNIKAMLEVNFIWYIFKIYKLWVFTLKFL